MVTKGTQGAVDSEMRAYVLERIEWGVQCLIIAALLVVKPLGGGWVVVTAVMTALLAAYAFAELYSAFRVLVTGQSTLQPCDVRWKTMTIDSRGRRGTR